MAFKPDDQKELLEYRAVRRDVLGRLDELIKKDRYDNVSARTWKELCDRCEDALATRWANYSTRMRTLNKKDSADADAGAIPTEALAWYTLERGSWKELSDQATRLAATFWAIQSLAESLQRAHIQHTAKAFEVNQFANDISEKLNEARDLIDAVLSGSMVNYIHNKVTGAPDHWNMVLHGIAVVADKAGRWRLVDKLMGSLQEAALAYWEEVQRDGRIHGDGLGKLLDVPKRVAMDSELREHYGRWVEEARREHDRLKRTLEGFEEATEKLRKGRFFEDDDKSRPLRPFLKDGHIAPKLDELKRSMEEARELGERERKAK